MKKPVFENVVLYTATGVSLLVFGAAAGVTYYWLRTPQPGDFAGWIQASAAVFSAGAVVFVARTLFQEERRERREVSTQAWADLSRLAEQHKEQLAHTAVLDPWLARAADCQQTGAAALACLRSYREEHHQEPGFQEVAFWQPYVVPLSSFVDLFVSICDQQERIKEAEEQSRRPERTAERSVEARVRNLARSVTTYDERRVLTDFINFCLLPARNGAPGREQELARVLTLFQEGPESPRPAHG